MASQRLAAGVRRLTSPNETPARGAASEIRSPTLVVVLASPVVPIPRLGYGAQQQDDRRPMLAVLTFST